MTDEPESEPTIDDLKAALHTVTMDRVLWKKSYGVLKKILIHYGFDIVEHSDGMPDLIALRLKGYLPPDPALDALLPDQPTKH